MRQLRTSLTALLLLGAVSTLHRCFISMLMTAQGAAGAAFDAHNSAHGVNVEAKRIANLESGNDRLEQYDRSNLDEFADADSQQGLGRIVARAAQPLGLDAGALLEETALGQTSAQGQGNTQEGGSALGQVTPQGQGSVVDISGLLSESTTGQTGSAVSSHDVAGDIVNQLAQGQDRGNASSNGDNVKIIQIEKTIILEANGQQIQTDIILEVGQQLAAAAPVTTPPPAQPTPLATPVAEIPAEVSTEMMTSSAAALGTLQPAPGAQPLEGMNVTVSTTHFLEQSVANAKCSPW
jgi:hypothetical protein